MAHLDMVTGAMTVNGRTSFPHVTDTCVACGTLSYRELFQTSNGVTPRDDWFPVSSRGSVLGTIVSFPRTLVPMGPFPSIDLLNIRSNIFLIYSNSVSNSFVINPPDNTITFTQTLNGLVIDQLSPTSTQ
jgi:hypothetical protein